MNAHNPYATPRTNVDADHGEADIDSLAVSKSWKEKFKAIKRAGGPNLPDLKKLTHEERKAIPMFSVLGFFFGPFYYLAKGMWKKALTLFVLTVIGIVVLDMVMELVGLAAFTSGTGFGAAAVYAVLANKDYYRKMVLGQNGWWW